MVEKKAQKNILNVKGLENILVRPRLTEKASLSMEKNVYVFEVSVDANKPQIAAAIKELYKVEPLKVNIVQIPPKRIIYRGKRGIKSGSKKAYIYLKEGDKINIM
ncbi:MAG: 50S ribosomal protein L23 [Patescibacteria group bacterium]